MSELYVCKQYDTPYERVCKIITTLDEHDKQIRDEVIDECIKLANGRFWLTMPQLTQAMEQLKGEEEC